MLGSMVSYVASPLQWWLKLFNLIFKGECSRCAAPTHLIIYHDDKLVLTQRKRYNSLQEPGQRAAYGLDLDLYFVCLRKIRCKVHSQGWR